MRLDWLHTPQILASKLHRRALERAVRGSAAGGGGGGGGLAGGGVEAESLEVRPWGQDRVCQEPDQLPQPPSASPTLLRTHPVLGTSRGLPQDTSEDAVSCFLAHSTRIGVTDNGALASWRARTRMTARAIPDLVRTSALLTHC